MDKKKFHDITQFFWVGKYAVHTLLEKTVFFSISPDNFPSSAFGTSLLFTSLFPLYIFLFFHSGCHEIGFSTVFIDYIHSSGMHNLNQYEGKSGIFFVPIIKIKMCLADEKTDFVTFQI